LRTGYAVPFGKTTAGQNGGTGQSLSDYLNGVLPLWVDAGYRFNPNMYIGADFQYGIGFINKAQGCSQNGISCSASDLMFGVDFQYHLMPTGTFDPWGSVGLGYEILNGSSSANGLLDSSSLNGFQFFNLQVGGDYKAMPNFGIGPFLMFSLGQFSNCSISGPNTRENCTIQQTAMHEWLTVGIRAVYDINTGG
jgi:hypothetical protein